MKKGDTPPTEATHFRKFDNAILYLEWLNEDPRVKKKNDDGSEYVPISCVQEDLFAGFLGNTKFELLRENLYSKGLSGVGRLHYKHPITGEWLFQDGSAAIPYLGGLHLDFPNLSARVLLSCAKKLGKRFGRELNRDQEDAPLAVIDPPADDDKGDTVEIKRMRLLLNEAKSMQELAQYKKDVPKELKPLYMEKLKSFV